MVRDFLNNMDLLVKQNFLGNSLSKKSLNFQLNFKN